MKKILISIFVLISVFCNAQQVPWRYLPTDVVSDQKLSDSLDYLKALIPDVSSFISSETDPIYNASSWKTTTNNSANWNTAYGWGNHAGLYRPIGYVPTWSEITSKPSFATVATSGSYNDLINKPTIPSGNQIIANSDSIDVLANLINDIETITELADVLEAQAGISDKLMTALRTAEQLELNAVSYYNVKEDIYSNFDATFDSIFASNLYQENVSVDAIGTAGVYDKEVETNNIEVFLNGVLQRENVHYTQTETQISFIMTPLADDYVTIKYKQ